MMMNNSSRLAQFLNYQSTKRLFDLAKQPLDLTDPSVLTPERISHFSIRSLSYNYLYATEKVSKEIIDTLCDLASEAKALDKMRHMQEGAIVNYIASVPCENRPALHTATRDFFDHPQTAISAKEATQKAFSEYQRLKQFVTLLERNNKFDDLIVIGIGGSDQGPRAHYMALEHLLKKGKKVHFIANVDPDDAAGVLRVVNLKRTLVVTISKSGTTLETETNEALVTTALKNAGCVPKEHLIAVTIPGSPMDNTDHYLNVFHLFDWVGGRYSTTSMVGGIVLSFAFGIDVYESFLKGAHDMDRAALEADPRKNIPLMCALIGIWNRNFLKYPTFAIVPYSQGLQGYPAHLQQVDMESNGKRIEQTGLEVNFETAPVLWGSLGTNSQHSYFQLLHQGTSPVPLLFIGYKKNRYALDQEVAGTTSQEKLLANLFAQIMALAQGNKPQNPNKLCPGNRPSSLLLGDQLTPYSLGVLLSLYEHKVAFQGFIWGINSFDQEGVQLGKIIANSLCDKFAAKRNKQISPKKDPIADAFLELV